MKSPLKIAVYSGEIPSTTFIERLVVGLSTSGCEVLLFGRLKCRIHYKGHVKILGYYSSNLYKGLYLLYYSLLLGLFRRRDKQRLDTVLQAEGRAGLYDKVKCYPVLWHQPDVFHVQWAKGLDEWMWVQAFGIKLVVSLRGAHINYSPLADAELATMYRETFSRVDGFHAVSYVIGKEAQRYGALANRIHLVYSGLSLEGIPAKLKPRKAGQPVFNIVSVGRPHWKKGYTYALDACKRLKEAGVTFNYTIVGGAEAIEYQYQVHDLGLQAEVQLLGALPFETVQRQMQRADVLLLPSVEEGIANVVLEAMAVGTLVLSTDCGGMSEVIRDGENGFLVPIRDVGAIYNGLQTIFNLSDKTVLSIQQAALETVRAQHAETEMVMGMCSLYEDILTDTSTSSV